MKQRIAFKRSSHLTKTIRRFLYFDTIFIAIFLSIVFLESEALAYLDPGIGSFALQVIAATLVAIGFLGRKIWDRVASFFTRHKSDK